MMTKKDYIALAKLIKENTSTIETSEFFFYTIQKDSFLDDLCIYLQSDNPNFNESKFREACGE